MTKEKESCCKSETHTEYRDKRNKMIPGRSDDRDFELSREDAKGGSPSDTSVGGEEDAGVGLEFVVRKNER